MNYSIEFYKINDNDEKSVVEKFFEKIHKKYDDKALDEILNIIKLLKREGNNLRYPYTERITAGKHPINCLRAKYRNNQFRIFYEIMENKIIILLTGYVKKDKKTNKKEIDKAVSYLIDYKKRSIDG